MNEHPKPQQLPMTIYVEFMDGTTWTTEATSWEHVDCLSYLIHVREGKSIIDLSKEHVRIFEATVNEV